MSGSPDRDRILYGDARVTPVTDLASAQARIATLEAALTQAERENLALRQKLDILCHKLFGKRSEAVSPDQLRLAFAQLAEELKPRDEPTEMDTGERPGPQHRRPPRPTGRRPLPASLPRHRVEIDLPEADKICGCGTTKTRIGEAVSEKLDYVPASVRVIETVRPKYACPTCHDGVVAAPAPPQAVERSLASEGLLAHIVVSKYLDHLPLYRLGKRSTDSVLTDEVRPSRRYKDGNGGRGYAAARCPKVAAQPRGVSSPISRCGWVATRRRTSFR
jgi:transposase